LILTAESAAFVARKQHAELVIQDDVRKLVAYRRSNSVLSVARISDHCESCFNWYREA